MKRMMLALGLFVFSSVVTAAEAPAGAAATPAPAAPSVVVQGKVLEVKDVESYTYLRLQTGNGEMWAAIMKTPVKKGTTVTVENGMYMTNFHSKVLKKTFQTIVFGNLAASGNAAAPGTHGMGASYPLMPGAKAKPLETINDAPVAKATGDNAYTVEEINSKRNDLKDKVVLVRGKVVKFNGGIMGKNWLHLRDGSGSDAKETNDILVTSAAEARVGDVVTVKGPVHVDKDFGAGYAYKVLIEDAAVQ